MSTQLDPRVSEFETQEQADSYDRWFRQRIERSLADPRPPVPHDEAMARVRAVIETKRRRAG
ncbi:antitoxin [Stutzerimonas stutzeri]|uniref:type II toxin-antitoxin system RelB family antitoxin n=1 Tax=Stutzerimonas stutzeri TaxID=316 RepID=UPI0015E357A4|nr:antitoxin [Stutzerimonas stutzeri]MBA1264206.1 antitoxin [Stutzerimonas stutzeri]